MLKQEHRIKEDSLRAEQELSHVELARMDTRFVVGPAVDGHLAKTEETSCKVKEDVAHRLPYCALSFEVEPRLRKVLHEGDGTLGVAGKYKGL